MQAVCTQTPHRLKSKYMSVFNRLKNICICGKKLPTDLRLQYYSSLLTSMHQFKAAIWPVDSLFSPPVDLKTFAIVKHIHFSFLYAAKVFISQALPCVLLYPSVVSLFPEYPRALLRLFTALLTDLPLASLLKQLAAEVFLVMCPIQHGQQRLGSHSVDSKKKKKKK